MFTQQEEDILKAMVQEFITRKKLDALRYEIDVATRNSLDPVIDSVKSNYAEALASLESDFNTAQTNLENKIK